MVNRPADFLDRLPTASELLDKPPIRALAERWNRSVVASGVRSFLDELRSDLERRAAEVQFPSWRELAERAARHVVAQQQSSVRPAINATGQFFGPAWRGLPLAEAALERLVAIGSGFTPSDPGHSPGDAAAIVCRLTGAEAATVVHSYAGAIWLAMASFAAKREVVIARAEVGDVGGNGSLAAIASAARATLQEVGSVNRSSAADYEAAIQKSTAAIWRNSPDDYQVIGQTQEAELEALIGLARDRELPLIASFGLAALVEGLPAMGAQVPTVAACVAAGAHLTIVAGNGLVGGPPCGILAGTREAIHRIESQAMFSAWRAEPATEAALVATLLLAGDPEQMQLTTPIFQLLGTSVENLRQRAERLAPQMAQADDVESAVAISTENCLGVARARECQLPSYAIALTPVHDDLNTLDRRLRNAAMPVVGRRHERQLLVDLRTVLPRQDQRLVEMVVGNSSAQKREENDAAATSIEPIGSGERS